MRSMLLKTPSASEQKPSRHTASLCANVKRRRRLFREPKRSALRLTRRRNTRAASALKQSQRWQLRRRSARSTRTRSERWSGRRPSMRPRSARPKKSAERQRTRASAWRSARPSIQSRRYYTPILLALLRRFFFCAVLRAALLRAQAARGAQGAGFNRAGVNLLNFLALLGQKSTINDAAATPHVRQCIISSHAARDVANRAMQIVPDDHPSLEEALEQAHSEWREGATGGARILVRNGRHPVRCGDEEGGEIELGCEGMSLEITGQEGACLYGTCVLGRGGGCIEGVKIESSQGPTVWATAGTWCLRGCELAAERSCATALLCSASAVIELQSCRIGGRGPLKEGSERASERARPEGERGNGALARHAVRLQGRAHATLRHCQLQHCSASTVSLHHQSSLALHGCGLSHAAAALEYQVSSELDDRTCLRIEDCRIDCTSLWLGHARPFSVVDRRNHVVFFTSSGTLEDHTLASYA